MENKNLVDFKKKFNASKTLLKVKKMQEFCDYIDRSTGYEAVRHWIISNTECINFCCKITDKLIDIGVTKDRETVLKIILFGTYSDFYHIIPEERRIVLSVPNAMEATDNTLYSDTNDLQDDCLHPLWIRKESNIMAPLVQQGKLDQKYHYLTPDSAENWYKIINDRDYNRYDECLDSIRKVCSHNIWRNFFTEGGADGIVMLGGGGPSKDKAVINATLNIQQKNKYIHYAMIDFSNYMLKSAFHAINSSLRDNLLHDYVNISLIESDFLDLSGLRQKLRRDKNIAWFLPGGTIGNLNELSLFRSVAKESECGDLFVVGAEVVKDNSDEFKKDLKEKYSSPEIKRLALAPLRSARDNINDGNSLNDIEVVIDVVDGESKPNRHSLIDGSITVAGSINNGEVVIFTSTRYDETKFVEFAKRQNFHLEDAIGSKSNPQYKQFIFRYGEPRQKQETN